MKYLSLTLLFCLMAFFSCEREDAFPETYGLVEPFTSSGPVDGELESVRILSAVTADINTVSDYFAKNSKDPSLITEADLETAAIATGVDLQAVYALVQEGISIIFEQNEDPEEIAHGIARNIRTGSFAGVKKLPCLKAYEQEMLGAIQRTVECSAALSGSPYAVTGCVAGYVILASIADNNFDKCLKRTYPNP